MQITSPPSTSWLRDAVTVCDNMRLTIFTEPDTKENCNKLRSVLSKLSFTHSNITVMIQLYPEDRRMNETIYDLCSEIGEISTIFGMIASTLSSFVDKFQML